MTIILLSILSEKLQTGGNQEIIVLGKIHMPNLSKEEMQNSIDKFLNTNLPLEALNFLKSYVSTYGKDTFVSDRREALIPYAPQVSLICLNCTDETVNNFLSEQTYSNLEIVRVSPEDSYSDIINYMCNTSSKYICFLEENHLYAKDKIASMVWALEDISNATAAVCSRNIVAPDNTLIAHPYPSYQAALKDTSFNGSTFLQFCIDKNINLYGNLSTIMVSSDFIRNIQWLPYSPISDSIKRINLLYHILLHSTIFYITNALVSSIACEFHSNTLAHEYEHYLNFLSSLHLVSLPSPNKSNKYESIKKEVTLFYTDKWEYYNLAPLAEEGTRRGYKVIFTDCIHQKAEIGIYCQHVCHPENSKFSLIFLHDMAQGHNRWPNLWELEPWSKFDIGVVPGEMWSSLWSECACMDYVNPRIGTFMFGYPKSDLVIDPSLQLRTDTLKQHFHLKYNTSVLYAPSWENDEKEDDFVRALASLPINLLIKQAHWSSSYQVITNNIIAMRKLHENKYDNVYYIEPEESIMVALKMCDLVISDESSVMAEAVMFNKPSIAVTDWLIPDTVPSRLASVPFDYVHKCKKVELREAVEKYLVNPAIYDFNLLRGKEIFSNVGHCCSDVFDAIDYYTQGISTSSSFLCKKLFSKYDSFSLWK